MILLTVGFIMFFLIGNHVIHCKTVLVRKIIDECLVLGVSSEIPAGFVRADIRIALQKPAHRLLVGRIHSRKVPESRFSASVQHGGIIAGGNQLRSPKQGVGNGRMNPAPVADQMETVHLEVKAPVAQHISDKSCIRFRKKIELRDAFQANLMEDIHHFRELLVRIIRGAVSLLWRKIKSLRVPPVIQNRVRIILRFLHLHLLIQIVVFFLIGLIFECIARHEDQRSHPHVLQIRDHLRDTEKCSGMLHARRPGLCEASHVKFVEDTVLIGYIEGLASCLEIDLHGTPVFFLPADRICDSTNRSGIGIRNDLPLYPIIVFIRSCILHLHKDCADVADPVFFLERNHLTRLNLPCMIEQKLRPLPFRNHAGEQVSVPYSVRRNAVHSKSFRI